MAQDRESCVAALAFVLEQIMTGSNPTITVTGVHRNLRTLDDIADDELPILFVEDDGLDQMRVQSEFADISFSVSIVSFVKKVPNELITTTINKLDKAIKMAVVSQDPPLGGAAVDALPIGLSYTTGSRVDGYGAFIRPVKITYKARIDAGM